MVRTRRRLRTKERSSFWLCPLEYELLCHKRMIKVVCSGVLNFSCPFLQKKCPFLKFWRCPRFHIMYALNWFELLTILANKYTCKAQFLINRISCSFDFFAFFSLKFSCEIQSMHCNTKCHDSSRTTFIKTRFFSK